MRLRRSDPSGPGISRRRRGKGFSYAWPDGKPVTEVDMLERISHLAIPPAWKDVWICPLANGHIQATGTDVAGRRQYRYHDEWRRKRDLEKFERMIHFGRALPGLRAVVAEDLARRGYGRERVLASAVRLLDVGYFRIGGEEYAEENETFGLSTMEREHVSIRGAEMRFDYPAKGGKRRIITIRDAEVAPLVRSLQRRAGGGEDLLAWRQGTEWCDVRSEDVNEYLKAGAGEGFSAKDFRTWSATVLAAVGVAVTSPASKTGGRRLVTAICKEVSEHLGNTPAVCRASYIDPRVFDRHQSGETIAKALKVLTQEADLSDPTLRAAIEPAVIALLQEESDAVAQAASQAA